MTSNRFCAHSGARDLKKQGLRLLAEGICNIGNRPRAKVGIYRASGDAYARCGSVYVPYSRRDDTVAVNVVLRKWADAA